MSESPLRVGLPPQIDAHARILILGSLPGETSLAAQQYYAHARNQFWCLLEDVTELPLVAAPYERRLALLREAGIGLWDVVASGHRRASNDAGLVAVTMQPVAALARSLPQLRLIASNGRKAAELLARHTGLPPLPRLTLPSSSAANTHSYAEKLRHWTVLRDFLRH